MLRCFKPFNVLFSLTLLTGNVCLAQDSLKIRILDKKQKTPIVYAYVEAGHNVRTYSDTLGYCNLGAMDAQDAVSIKCLGYKDCKILVKEISKSGIIYLNPKEIALDEFVVTSKSNETIKVTYIRRANSFTFCCQSSINGEYCTFVPLPAAGSKKIACIRIKMERRKEENPVRLHIYSANEQGLPDKELLESNVIIYNRNIRKGQYALNVADKNIRIAGDKVFIGVEWPGLYYPQKDSLSKEEIRSKLDIGPRVICVASISDPRTFRRYADDSIWRPAPRIQDLPFNMLVSLDYTVGN